MIWDDDAVGDTTDHYYNNNDSTTESRKSSAAAAAPTVSPSPRQRGQLPTTITIALLDATDLLAMDRNGKSDPYCRFRIASSGSKYRSKTCYRTVNPVWNETFELHHYESDDEDDNVALDATVDVHVWDWDFADSDDYLGQCSIDLRSLEREKTYALDVALSPSGRMRLLVTVGRRPAPRRATSAESRLFGEEFRVGCARRYAIGRTFGGPLSDVGTLLVRVLRADDLKNMDVVGKSDPFW